MTNDDVMIVNELEVETSGDVLELGTVSEDTLGTLFGSSLDGGWGTKLP